MLGLVFGLLFSLLRLRSLMAWLAIIAGGTYVFRRNRRAVAGDRPHFLVTQGRVEFRPTGEELNDAVASVLMGMAIIDMRGAREGMGESGMSGPAKLDAMVVMGRTQVIVPENWVVRMDVRPMAGMVRDARMHASQGEGMQGNADLVITGRVIMGALEVSSQMPVQQQQMSMGRQAA